MPEPEYQTRPISSSTNGYHHQLPATTTSKWSKEGLTTSSWMDLDLDLDSPWPFDQFFSSSTSTPPPPPFLLSDQPCSPLWTFTDDTHDDKSGAGAGAGTGTGTTFYPRCFSFTVNQDSTTTINEDKTKTPPQTLNLTPLDYQDGSCLIKERMTRSLRYFKDSSEQQHVLAQVWAPVKNGNKYVLTTSGQPFVLDPNSNMLHQYRMVSLMYNFSLDGKSDDELGLPGRVFRQKLPEWTPNVQYYSSKEFSRLNHALNFNVQGTLALPVFDHSGQSRVGVLELIMTSQKINYAPEVDKVCKALEAVNLKSSDILNQSNTQICNEGRQNALTDILEVLTVTCETHKLPLAQTWVPCMHRSVIAYGGGLKKTCSSFDGLCMGKVCMSTSDITFYVIDPHKWGFREACVEHHLQKGQGVVGKAFELRKACFCSDVSMFCKNEYPLVHYARLFGLTSSFSICLRSFHTGDDDYILEFFLPTKITDHRNLLNSILVTMKPHFRSLSVASGKDIEDEWRFIEFLSPPMDDNVDLKEDPVPVPIPLTKVNGKKGERKRGKAEKTISLEVLQQYFSGSLKDAAKSLGVCPTTMKRICRQHGISRWPSRKINKVNRSLTKLKSVIESVQGSEGTFTLTSLAASSLPVNSISWPASLNNHQPGPVPQNEEQTPILKSGSSKETSSEPSCYGNEEARVIEDVGSSFDEYRWNNVGPTIKTITIKSTYREDIIRFRFDLSSGINKMKEEVAKKLKLELGTFDIKYLDDDHEWVLIVCDADLQECVEISRLSGGNIVRLLVHDITANLGSSCESSGESALNK